MDKSVAAIKMVEEGQNQPEFPLKLIRFEEIRDEKDEDRISRLPDCLLVEILSRLPTTECAVRTGTLSKRWKQIWTSVHVLVFSQDGHPTADFISSVDETLTQRGQLNLNTFRVYCEYSDQCEPHVRNWIRYASECKVEELSLLLLCENDAQFLLDQCFFINSCFTDLTLWGCIFNPVGAINWGKLTSLYCYDLFLNEYLIENILSGSPVLETLELKQCSGFRRLNITSKSVKKLVFDGFKLPLPDDELYQELASDMEINAPNILSLTIQDDLRLWRMLLINVSSLVEAELNYTMLGFYDSTGREDEEEMLKRFILDLRHVKEVKIGMCCCGALSRLEDKGFICPSNLKVCVDCASSSYFDDELLEVSDRSSSDSDESRDGPTGDELQEPFDATASSSGEDDEADD